VEHWPGYGRFCTVDAGLSVSLYPTISLPHHPVLIVTIRWLTCSLFLTLQTLVGFGQITADSAGTQQPTGRLPNPYALSWKVDGILLGTAAVTGLTSYLLEQQVTPYTVADLSRFDRSQVNAFDRGATYNWSPRAFRISDQALTGNFVATGLIALPVLFRHKGWATVPLMYIEVLAVPTLFQQTVKNIALRTRPYVYNPGAPLEPKLVANGRQSFFSGHAGTAFASAVFAAELFRQYYPNSKLKPVVWIVMLGLASTTSYMRYAAGYHYPSDILAGAALGSFLGWGIPKWHEVRNRPGLGQRMTIQPWHTGQASGLSMRLLLDSR